jgi:hypothetical protein
MSGNYELHPLQYVQVSGTGMVQVYDLERCSCDGGYMYDQQ